MSSNPSIERTASSRLSLPPAAAHVERSAVLVKSQRHMNNPTSSNKILMTAGQGKQLRVRWKRWIHRLDHELTTLLISRHFFNTVGQIVDANERIREPFDFHWWIIYNYIVTTSVSIRRLMDHRPDTISLYGLLKEIEANPGGITRRSFVSRYPAFVRQSAHRTFDKLAGSRSVSFPPSCARLDRQRLYREHRRIRTWVNKNFAHLDQKNMHRKPPTLDAVHNAVTLFEEIFLKYRLLLTGIESNTLLPIWQHDWTTVLREPWLT